MSKKVGRKQPPSDIKTIPNEKVVYNGPSDDYQQWRLQLTNGGVRRIAFQVQTWSAHCQTISCNPANGVLEPNELTTLWITLHPFDGYTSPLRPYDRLTIEWTDTAANSPKKYNRAFFADDPTNRRKDMVIQYNE